MLNTEQQAVVARIVSGWAAINTKSTLAVLALMALRERPRWAGDLQDQLRSSSAGSIEVDMPSLHRMLRRLHTLGLIRCSGYLQQGPGAARKIYVITHVGEEVLRQHLLVNLAYVRSTLFRRAQDGCAEMPGASGCDCPCPQHGRAASPIPHPRS